MTEFLRPNGADRGRKSEYERGNQGKKINNPDRYSTAVRSI